MRVSLIIFGVLILLVGIAFFYEALLIYQFTPVVVNTPVQAAGIIENDYLVGGFVVSVIGIAMLYLGLRY